MRRLIVGAVFGATALLGPSAVAADGAVSGSPGSAPAANGRVDAFAATGGTLFLGGAFTTLGGQPRNHVAALDASTAQLRSWHASVTGGTVLALAASPDGGTLYLGGSFTAVNGQHRAGLAALAVSDARLLSWNPGVSNGTVQTLAVSGTAVYAGGNFSASGGTTIGRLAAISRATGKGIASFDPHPDSEVRGVTLVGSTLYLGGKFTHVHNLARQHVAAVTTGGAVTAWHPTVSAPVDKLAATTGRLYVALSGGGATGNGVAALSTSTSGAPLWTRNGDGNAQAVTVLGGVVYLGGHFAHMAGQTRHHAAAFNASGTLLGWSPVFNSSLGVWAMHAVGSTLWVGGDFTQVNYRAHPHLARFS